jgi:hypothetical protein
MTTYGIEVNDILFNWDSVTLLFLSLVLLPWVLKVKQITICDD